MPEESIEKMRRALDQADVMVPASKSDVTTLAMIEAMRAQTDVLQRISKRQDQDAETMKEVGETLHSIDKRLLVIESNSIERDVKANADAIEVLEGKVEELEKLERERIGAGKFAKAMKEYGPILVLVIVAVVILALTGSLKL